MCKARKGKIKAFEPTLPSALFRRRAFSELPEAGGEVNHKSCEEQNRHIELELCLGQGTVNPGYKV